MQHVQYESDEKKFGLHMIEKIIIIFFNKNVKSNSPNCQINYLDNSRKINPGWTNGKS